MLVTAIVEDQREAVRVVLTASMEAGRGPRAAALDIVGRVNRATGRREGGILGLTSRQAEYVTNMRAELRDPDRMAGYFTRTRRDRRFDGMVRRAMREGKPVAAADVDRISGRYSDRLLKLRGETIARTELMQSLHEAQDEGLRQMVDRGALRTEQIMREWSAASDAATRPTHAAAHGQRRRQGEPFMVGGYQMMHPGDRSLGAPAAEVIACRCHLRVELDFISELGPGD